MLLLSFMLHNSETFINFSKSSQFGYLQMLRQSGETACHFVDIRFITHSRHTLTDFIML
jgi:hypothetical protein